MKGNIVLWAWNEFTTGNKVLTSTHPSRTINSMFSLLVALLPLVSFLSPTPGQIISGSKVPVKIAVTNLSLVDYRTHPRLVSGQGHIHLWLDQTDLSRISAVKAVSDTYTFENVKPGNHTLVAELVRNDHSSFTPPLTTTISFQTTTSSSPISFSLLTISLLSFLILVITLYFLTQNRPSPKSKRSAGKSPRKSSKTASKRSSRK